MITVDEALSLVAEHSRPLAPRDVALPDALGQKLTEPVVSDVDSPPFDKSLFDGYAVDADDPAATRRVIEEVVAGDVPQHSVAPGFAIRVMTGAPMPKGATSVAKVEDCQLQGDQVSAPVESLASGAGVLKRGESFAAGEVVVESGVRLGPLEIALLAEIGKARVATIPRPAVALLPTGDELVPYNESPGPGQIRNSNGPMLAAALAARGLPTKDVGIARDDPADLRARIQEGLAADVLLLTGGVSAGVLDLAPGVLADLGVRQVFHKVRVKPGKPVWFGVYTGDADHGGHTLVYGLPGNPVSALVCFALFVVPALRTLAGEAFARPQTIAARLLDAAANPGKRPTYHPALLQPVEPQALAKPGIKLLTWRGSADLRAVARANALAILPAGFECGADGADVAAMPIAP